MFPESPTHPSARHLGPPPRRSGPPTPYPPEQNPRLPARLRFPRPPSRRSPLHLSPEKPLASPHPTLSGAPLPPRPPRASSLRTPFPGSAPLRPEEGAPGMPTGHPSFRNPPDLSNVRILTAQSSRLGLRDAPTSPP